MATWPLSVWSGLRDAIVARYTLLGLTWAGDPGAPTKVTLGDLLAYRSGIIGLAPHFCDGATVTQDSWQTVAQRAFGADTWRAAGTARAPHYTYDYLDAKAALEEMVWLYLYMVTGLTSAKAVWEYEAFNGSTYEDAWDRAHTTDTPAVTYGSAVGGALATTGVAPYIYAWASAGYIDWDVVARPIVPPVPAGSVEARTRIIGTRTLSGTGAAFGYVVEGSDVAVTPVVGDPGTMTTLATSGSAGSGAFDDVWALPRHYRYMRLAHADWWSATCPFGEAIGGESLETNTWRLALRYEFAPF